MSVRAALSLGLALSLPGAGASAIEGRFATPDGGLALEVEAVDGRNYTVTLEGADADGAQTFRFEPGPAPTVLVEAKAPASWRDRLMGDRMERLPVPGKRMAFARVEDEALVLTVLLVDEQGHTTLDRYALTETAEGAVLDRRQITGDGLEMFEPTALERVR